MKQTKEQLLKELGKVQEAVRNWQETDLSVRERFSGLLDGNENAGVFSYGAEGNKKAALFSWLEIAFKIGELKSDAEYTMLLVRESNLRLELVEAKKKIRELENPSAKTTL